MRLSVKDNTDDLQDDRCGCRGSQGEYMGRDLELHHRDRFPVRRRSAIDRGNVLHKQPEPLVFREDAPLPWLVRRQQSQASSSTSAAAVFLPNARCRIHSKLVNLNLPYVVVVEQSHVPIILRHLTCLTQ